MILLDGHSLTPKTRILPESLSLTLKEKESTATMIPDTMSGINTRSWFLDETNPGKGIVWRVKSIGNVYATETPTVELEHVICTLRDRILFGEVTPEMIGGSDTCTAEQAVRFILKKQSDWVLGKFAFSSVRNPYKFDGNNLYDALISVTKSLKNAWWSYDLTVYPFKLNITERPADPVCELRAGRNLTSVTRTQDLSSTYTRFYPIGKDDLHIAGNYVSRNEKTYGVIEHVEVNTSLETEAELIRWANEKLDVHAQPLDTIEIEGIELADATGESLDRLRIGRVCRVPLPEYGTTIEEKITQLRYADKIHAPAVVQVTLANDQEDLAQVIADAIKEGAGPSGSGGRGGARQDKEDHAWFEDTDTHVAMVAEGIVGTDKDGNPDWARLSKIVVDGQGIHQTVEVVKEDVGNMKSSIEQNENEIKQEVKARTKQGKEISSTIRQTASSIRSEVKDATKGLRSIITTTESGLRTYVANTAEGLASSITQTAGQIRTELTNTAAGLESSITQTAGQIELKVSKNGVISSINQTPEQISISASRIDLSGYVTASDLEATNASITNLTSGITQASSLKATAVNVVTGFTYQNHAIALQPVTIDGVAFHLMGYRG